MRKLYCNYEVKVVINHSYLRRQGHEALTDLINFYFFLGLRKWQILVSLSNVDGIIIDVLFNSMP